MLCLADKYILRSASDNQLRREWAATQRLPWQRVVRCPKSSSCAVHTLPYPTTTLCTGGAGVGVGLPRDPQ